MPSIFAFLSVSYLSSHRVRYQTLIMGRVPAFPALGFVFLWMPGYQGLAGPARSEAEFRTICDRAIALTIRKIVEFFPASKQPPNLSVDTGARIKDATGKRTARWSAESMSEGLVGPFLPAHTQMVVD